MHIPIPHHHRTDRKERNPMHTFFLWIATLTDKFIHLPTQPDEGERGDVPGWVLITLMTVALVIGIWAIAGPQLQNMLEQALSSVNFG